MGEILKKQVWQVIPQVDVVVVAWLIEANAERMRLEQVPPLVFSGAPSPAPITVETSDHVDQVLALCISGEHAACPPDPPRGLFPMRLAKVPT